MVTPSVNKIAWLPALLVAFGCELSTPTQVLVVFEADPGVEAAAERLVIEVTNQDGERQEWQVELRAGEPMATRFPVTLPLVPRGADATRTYAIAADVLGEGGAVVSTQRVRSGYVDGELREIRVRFTDLCRMELCGARTTCRGGRCVDACVVPSPRGDTGLRLCDASDAGPLDAAIFDAALPDAGGGDAGLDETSCDDLHAGALFCDGFEAPLPGAWDSSRETGGSVGLSSLAYRGSSSLEAVSTAPSAFVYLRSGAIAGVSDDLFVRFYLYLPAGQEIADLNLVYAGEGAAPFGGLALGLFDGGRVFALGLPADVRVSTGESVDTERWVCLEAHVSMDPAAGVIEIFVDGVPRGRAEGLDTFADTGVTGMNVGLGRTAAAQPPVRVLLDEFVASRTRIGCD